MRVLTFAEYLHHVLLELIVMGIIKEQGRSAMSHRDEPYKHVDYTDRFREHYREVAKPFTRWHQVAYREVNDFLTYCNKRHDVKVHLCPRKGVQDKTIHLLVNINGVYETDMPVTLFLQSVDETTEEYNIIFAGVGDDKQRTEPYLLLDQLDSYARLLDAVVKQAATYKADKDFSISAGMSVTRK